LKWKRVLYTFLASYTPRHIEMGSVGHSVGIHFNMAAWRYEVYLRVLDIFHVSKTNRNFVSRSGHIMFCLLSKQWNTEPFHFNIFCSSNRDNVFARNLTSYFIGVHTINNLLLFLCPLVYFAWSGPLEITGGEVTITEKKILSKENYQKRNSCKQFTIQKNSCQ